MVLFSFKTDSVQPVKAAVTGPKIERKCYESEALRNSAYWHAKTVTHYYHLVVDNDDYEQTFICCQGAHEWTEYCYVIKYYE